MNVKSYLSRIGYDGPTDPSAQTLSELHNAHVLSVPFENLDIHLGRRIVVDPAAFYDKIVTHHRGGFCYELNGLFSWLLRELGFQVTLLSARVYGGNGPGREFDHLILQVDLDEPWLADVGFGDSFREPLRLDHSGEQKQGSDSFRISREADTLTMSCRHPGTDWEPRYLFSLQPRQLMEFSSTCDYQQTSPDSHFTQRRICTLATANGRITLGETHLIVTEDGERRETAVDDPEEYLQLLRRHFGIDLDGAVWRSPS
jgi:N-hydroxyarylamine O-acetyltransferase